MKVSLEYKNIKRLLRWTARLLMVGLFVLLSIGSPLNASPATATDGVNWDYFNSFDGWWWIGADPPEFELIDNGGGQFIRIALAGSDPEVPPRNLLMRQIADGNFTITTRLLFEPTTNFQFAGLVIYQDADNFLQFGRAFCDTDVICDENGLYFDYVINGERVGDNYAKSVLNLSEAYLSLERSGSSITAYYSPDGNNWDPIGTHDLDDVEGFEVNGVGLTAGQDYYTPVEEEYFADFDYLAITSTAGEWRDDFNGPTLNAWWWQGSDPPQWSLEAGEYLRMTASQVEYPRNMVLRQVAEGDFAITTRVLFEPNTNFQFAGLVIYQDANNFLQFGRAYCDIEGICVGNGLYFDYVPNMEAGNFSTPADTLDEAYLRLERRGDMVRALYSHDGHTSWREIGTHWIPSDFRVNGVGLTASQDYNQMGIAVDFDYFSWSEGSGFLPDGYHDYDQGDVPNWACNAGGWVVDPDDPETEIQVEIVVDDITVDYISTEECVDGRCSFFKPLWDEISSYEPHTVTAWAQDIETGDWVLLRNSPKPLNCRTYDIYAYTPKKGTTQQITDMRDTHEFNPKWSPDGKKVVYHVFALDWQPLGLYVTDLKTGVSAQLNGAEKGYDAAWSPSGKWIAFDQTQFGEPDLYIVPSTGGQPKMIREDATSPSWSPDSDMIAFGQRSDYSIRVVRLADGSETLVATEGETPAWSPDGEWIAFRRGDSIWKVRVYESGLPLAEPVPVTSLIPDTARPSWSQNSKTIVFHSGQTRDYDLWTIPADGGTPTWLTGAPGFGDYDPNYSYNGKDIAYASFSLDGQAARQWISAYTADLPTGFWSVGLHNYQYEWEWSYPEPGSLLPEYRRDFEVSYNAPRFDGFVLLRGERLHGFYTEEGDLVCEGIDAVNPDQATRFLGGWLTEYPMTYDEAAAHFASMTARAVIDDSIAVELSPYEIQSWSSLDWGGYVCTLSLGPPRIDLRVNYADDWVESFYEEGHQIDITVTESDPGSVIATATVFTAPRDEWGGQSGFQTIDEDWSGGSRPDIQPGDWIFATSDNGVSAQIQIGTITGIVDSETDSITGQIFAPDATEPVLVECLDWGSGGEPINKDAGFIEPNGGGYSCSWDPVNEWDVLPGQNIGIGYFTPGGHWVANAFHSEE